MNSIIPLMQMFYLVLEGKTGRNINRFDLQIVFSGTRTGYTDKLIFFSRR